MIKVYVAKVIENHNLSMVNDFKYKILHFLLHGTDPKHPIHSQKKLGKGCTNW